MWLSDAEEDIEPDDELAASDQASDMLDDMPDDDDDGAWSEEELDDSYDPTDVDDFG